MEITYIVFRQILKMFLMMGIGFGCYKIRFFTTKGSQVLSDTALFIVLPCVIFTSFQIEYDRQILYGIIVSFVLAAAAHIVAMGAAYLWFAEENRNKGFWNGFTLYILTADLWECRLLRRCLGEME